MPEWTPPPISLDPIVVAGLTRREYQVLLAVGRGLTSKEIGLRLRIAPETVDKHVQNGCHKLGFKKRIEAARALLAFDRLPKIPVDDSVGASSPLPMPADQAPCSSADGGSDGSSQQPDHFAGRDMGSSGGGIGEPRGDAVSKGGDMFLPDGGARAGVVVVAGGLASRGSQRDPPPSTDRVSTARLALAPQAFDGIVREVIRTLGYVVAITAIQIAALALTGGLQIIVQNIDHQFGGG